MCGIAGFVIQDLRLNKEEAKHILSKMCQSIRYRGPDDHGIYLFGFDNQNTQLKVGLGHNRLSIIDLTSAGHQPMTNEDNSIWLTYNGEIYNFLELRESLLKKGHIFRSKMDTEVIIHSWEEWKEGCLDRFNGMFTFALWDGRKRMLMLARDLLKEGLLGAGAGAVGGLASGAKGGDVWKGALAGAGVNIVGFGYSIYKILVSSSISFKI